MNKILLINRINTNSFQEINRRIFFIIGDIETNDTLTNLMEILDKIEFLTHEDIVYKYNGVEISMNEKNIPKIVKSLTDSDIDIYSIYELYDPME